jgi:flagellar L-ring protein FlgH
MTLRAIALLLVSAALAGCSIADRLGELGSPPKMTEIGDVRRAKEVDRIRYPIAAAQIEPSTPSSLWRPGSRGFFKDQRATRTGDIVTVKITMADSANLSNETKRDRSNSDNLSLGNLFGYRQRLLKALPGTGPENTADPLLNSSGTGSLDGKGSAVRSESVTVNLAAVIVQELPNGNFVIAGRQQLRVNQELRDIELTGIIRPEDIDTSNAISSEKIAEARLSYGGRGVISDYQQPPVGAQLMEIIRPF